ncbi:hypothetical protein FAGAP_11438 [Fusarium agapanthi]|uniref:Uncharacterized protein n=1 Tax=Fusarium agapanthi TaxID=1803897 RepID=A0A9P5AZ17_9HYPO|nr:hypothetical protein FAGAP_11438 [Fusarium agapanthi]
MASNHSSSLRSDFTRSICTSSSERSSDFTSKDSATNEPNTRFVDKDDDPLIPSLEDVYRTFQEGKATWEAFLSQAKRIPRGLWPRDALNPYVTLVDVPSLPEELPRNNWLYGRPCWELSHDIGDTECRNTDSRSDTTSLRPGRLVSFRLQIGDPIRCDICPDAASYACASPETTDSLAVLVMCWSYILSARLLEMQRRGIRYTEDRLWPTVPYGRKETTADINLRSASPTLIRWLCAILSPAMGWQARDHGHLPPWATSFKTDVALVIEASDMAADVCSPPSSIEAMELLIELCRLFGLGIDSTRLTDFEPMPPYKASFLAALALPFYNFMELQPQLPHPRLAKPRNNSTFDSSHEQQLRGYLCHIRYFMTLSAHPPSIGSILWSVFWQPDVNCNLVGPWLASVLDTLELIIAQNEIEVLLKVFLSRRPRIGIWWVALFFLGDSALLDWIRRYAVKMEEKRGFGSLSSPDPMVSAWTGSKQSFIDFDKDLLYLEPSDSVSRADLLRCRFDLKLQDSATTALSWRPFGHIEKSLVELELWPQLETKYTRRYNAFVWYPRKNFSILDEGFRKDTGQHIVNVPDNLKMHTSTDYSEKKYRVTNMRPSKDSTSKMMGFLVEGVGGGRDWANAGLSMQPKQLRWLRDWEGLDRMENNAAEQEPSRTPSWLLEKWINGEI